MGVIIYQVKADKYKDVYIDVPSKLGIVLV